MKATLKALPRMLLRPVRLWMLAAAFACVAVLGHSFAAVGSAAQAAQQKALTALWVLGLTLLYGVAMQGLRYALQAPPRPAKAGGGRLCQSPVRIGGWLLLCWLPWYVCLFPGTVSNDSISQMMQLLGLAELSNANPVFQTWLVGVAMQVGEWLQSPDAGVALYCVVQVVLLAWLLGALLYHIRSSAAPRWLWAAGFWFCALCPVFPVFAFCVGKDTNFAMAVLWLSLLLKQLTDTPPGGRVPARRVMGLCAAAVLCMLLRNPGLYLALLSLGVLLLWALMRRNGLWRAPACALACVAAVYAALHLWVLPGLNIAPMPQSENYSVPLQQVARVAAGNALTPEERAIVDAVIPVSELPAAYNGELSDRVKDLWREDAPEEAKRAFFAAWPRIVLKNPGTCLSATFHNTYGYLLPGFMSSLKPTLLLGDQATRTASVKGLFDYSVNPLAARLKDGLDALARCGLYRVLVAPGLYGCLTLFTLFCALGRGRRRALIAMTPALFTLAGCMLSAVNGYFRYAMPLYLCAPLLMWLTAQPGKKEARP